MDFFCWFRVCYYAIICFVFSNYFNLRNITVPINKTITKPIKDPIACDGSCRQNCIIFSNIFYSFLTLEVIC